jgi:serine/threonine protein kinase
VLEGLVYLHEQGVIHRDIKGHKYIDYERASLLHLMLISTCFFFVLIIDFGGKKHGKDSMSKPSPEPPKDYIHVRARCGEATDNHILANRVQFLWISIAFFLESYRCDVCLCSVSLLLLNNSGEKGKDKPKDEASVGSCAGLQQGNKKALIVDIHSLAGHLE